MAHKYSRLDLEECTVRQYLVELSRQCWVECEGFSGKRPFGNSGWQLEVAMALADGGFVARTLDSDGNWLANDESEVDELVNRCFDRLAAG